MVSRTPDKIRVSWPVAGVARHFSPMFTINASRCLLCNIPSLLMTITGRVPWGGEGNISGNWRVYCMVPAHHNFGITWLSSRTLMEHPTVVLVRYTTECYRFLHRVPFSGVLFFLQRILSTFFRSLLFLTSKSASPSTDPKTRVTDKGEWGLWPVSHQGLHLLLSGN